MSWGVLAAVTCGIQLACSDGWANTNTQALLPRRAAPQKDESVLARVLWAEVRAPDVARSSTGFPSITIRREEAGHANDLCCVTVVCDSGV